ncbi:hypothetical protein TrVE_jg11201 [Triparma verrucosa]|uniref:Uncharacterized protein n=1 Tax=Triparma verrucosa TaxID=1606542 RepID=A0A9W7CG55_9STRA|nr:hypothetical protein TrVE_jg11201 [Triparma verrucosa]
MSKLTVTNFKDIDIGNLTIDKDEDNDHKSRSSSYICRGVPQCAPIIPSFFFTDDWRLGLFVENMPLDMLMTMRLLCKDWQRVADRFIDGKIESGEMIVVGGNDISGKEAWAVRERRSLATQVVFLLNVTKVGDRVCSNASNLAVVEIPEGVESIGVCAFYHCTSLTTVSFPASLRSIAYGSFQFCSSLDNVDLLHTQLQELGDCAFWGCSELKSMTIPDSLQTIGNDVFIYCLKLVPSHIDVDEGSDSDADDAVTHEVIAHLRSQQNP